MIARAGVSVLAGLLIAMCEPHTCGATVIGGNSPSISIADTSAVEGNADTGTIVFTLTLSRTSALPVTVTCVTADGTAVAGQDFVEIRERVTFDAGITSAVVQVPLLADTDYEPAEFFEVTLGSPINATIGDGSGVATIFDDDEPVPPAIIIHPRSLILGVGSKASFGVSVLGSGPLSYRWSLNETNLSESARVEGTTGPELNISGVLPEDQFYYTLTVTNQKGKAVSLPASLWVLEPPLIINQPVEQAVFAGEPAMFQVQVTGIDPVRYQWRRNGMPIPGATEATLAFGSVGPPNVGRYDVVVSDAVGTNTSRAVRLRLVATPVITGQPAGANILLGTPALTLTVAAAGSPPLQYQWRRNGEHIPGATSNSYSIAPVERADGGSYSVVVLNEAGAVLSASALVLFTDIPFTPNARDYFHDPAEPILETTGMVQGDNLLATREPGEPHHADKPGGGSVWFTWTATDTGIATFDTIGSGFDTLLAVYSGNTLASLVSVIADDDRGGFLTSQVQFNAVAGETYQIAIDGLGGQRGPFVLGWSLEVTPESNPVIVVPPSSQTVAEGQDVTLSVVAFGAPPLAYQWRRNGMPLTGAVGDSLILPGVQSTNVGDYTVEVSNVFGRVAGSHPGRLQLGVETTGQALGKFECLLPLDGSGGGGGGLHAAAVGAPGGAQLVVVRAGVPDKRVFDGGVISGGVPLHCQGSPRARQWMWMQITNDGDFFLQASATNGFVPTLLAVYSYDPLIGALVTPLVVCAATNSPDGRSTLVSFPATAGAYFGVMVDRLHGAGGIVQLDWTLGRRPRSANPSGIQTRIAQLGGFVMLNAAITNAPDPPPRFQWFREGRAISGQTNPVLILAPLTNRHSGQYSVRATNAVGAIDSAWCLRVGTEVGLDVGFSNIIGAQLMQVTAGTAQDFVLQAAPDFNPPVIWTNLATKTGTNCFCYSWPVRNTNVYSHGFFRAIQMNPPGP